MIKQIGNIIKNMLYLIHIGVGRMKKISYHQKEMMDKKSKKCLYRKTKNNKKNKLKYTKTQYTSTGVIRSNTYIANAPTVLSFFHNTEETMKFFEDIINDTKRHKFGRKYFFNLSQVETLTIDAVMYIIAILKNLKTTNIYNFTFEGNMPENELSRKLIDESGFHKFVNSNSRNVKPNTNKIQIVTGKLLDPNTASEICDFVNEICGKDVKFTKALYEILIELMDNTTQHAYAEKEDLTVSQWYLFVENKDTTIQFIFLDTGKGIPATINKKLIVESKLVSTLLKKNDSDFILSTLNGEFRSKTKQSNRGKGLPWIYNHAKNNNISNFMIFSRNGCCSVQENIPVKCIDYKNQIFGTLLCWELNKNNNIFKEDIDYGN